MIPSDDRGFNLLTARWLALGAAAGATLSLLADQLGVEGPWQGAALVLAFLALFGSTAMAFAVHRRERELHDQTDLNRRGAAEINADSSRDSHLN